MKCLNCDNNMIIINDLYWCTHCGHVVNVWDEARELIAITIKKTLKEVQNNEKTIYIHSNH